MQSGFAEPGVDTLKEAAGVSLRTLYKYFPSREAMIIGALDHRHRRYLTFLSEGDPNASHADPIVHLFERVGQWMEAHAAHGCLFVSALAAHPDSGAIRATLMRHKSETRDMIAGHLSRRDAASSLPDQLMIVHEGLITGAVATGPRQATKTALELVRSLFSRKANP